MRRAPLVLLLVLAVAPAAAERASPRASPAPGPAVPLASLLPAGIHDVEVLEWSASARYAELVRRYGDAVQRDPRWFHAQRAAARGGPLPYDARCGLSESEYAELLAGVGAARLAVTGRESLEVRWDAGGLRLAAGAAAQPLAEVAVDATLAVDTPFGACRGWRPFAEDLPGVGRVQGHECRRQEVGPSLELVDSVRLAVGTLEGGERLLVYQGSRKWRDVAQRQATVYLRFPAPETPTALAAR